MKKGFTLVELLAVIVILAIISIIAIPIVIDMINNSKEKSNKEGLNLYIDTVSKRIANSNLDVLYNPDICTIQSTGDLLCLKDDEELYVDEEKTNKILEIKMNGKKPSEGTLYFTDGKITTGENIKYNDLYYTVTNGVVSKGSKEKTDITVAVISNIKIYAKNVTGRCEIQNTSTMICDSVTKTLQQAGKKATEGIIDFENGEITSYVNLKIEGRYYHQNTSKKKSDSEKPKNGILVEKNGTGEFNKGDKYTYKVNDTDTFNFYILTEPEDGQVNLIMDRNICNDGTVNYTRSNNYCRYQWHAGEDNNNYGPDTVMKALYNGTKGWNNVPDMMINYTDENNTNDSEKGYVSIITDLNTKTTTIAGKQNKISNDQNFGNLTEPLKAKIPTRDELNKAGCTGSNGSCPVWLMENITYRNVSNDKYSMNNNNEIYQQNIWGYWTLSSLANSATHAYLVVADGAIVGWGNRTTYDCVGARPVITVNTSDLSS